MDSNGDFIVVWEGYGTSQVTISSIEGSLPNFEIYAQRFDSSGTKAGSEFQVNTYQTEFQGDPDVAMDNNGNFVVTWASRGPDTTDDSMYSIQARRFTSDGNPQANQFQVNTYTDGRQQEPAVAMDSDGDFVVVWASQGSNGTDSDNFSIQGQRYNNSGTKVGDEIQVNSYTKDQQRHPDAAMDNDGDFVVVWQTFWSPTPDHASFSIWGQRYDKNGSPQGDEFQGNSYYTGDQIFPAVALDDDGDFVVVFQSQGSSGTDNDLESILIQRFTESGIPSGAEYQVNTYTTGAQQYPVIAMDDNGDYIVVWQSDQADTDPDESIQAQRFSPSLFEIQVNTYTSNTQSLPAVAMDSNGDFVITWRSFGSVGDDNDSTSIQGQRFDSEGHPLGDQFQVNTYTTSVQTRPAVAMDADGDFVVIWQSYYASSGDMDWSIQGQLFTNSGAKQGGQFQVNILTSGVQYQPSVAMNSDGDFVVVWDSYGSVGNDNDFKSIQGRLYDSSGSPDASGQFQINTYIDKSQQSPSVAMDSDGNFVVVWESYGPVTTDPSGFSIQGQRYNSSGAKVNSEFQVNSYTSSNQFNPAIAMDADGDFVVVWQSYGSAEGDTSIFSIQGQRFHADATENGPQFQVNTYTLNMQRKPDVAMDSFGDFVVVWESYGSPGDDDEHPSVQAQRYFFNGEKDGDQFQVNSYTTSYQEEPAVAMDSNGDFVMVWKSEGSWETDLTGYSIQMKLYKSNAKQIFLPIITR